MQVKSYATVNFSAELWVIFLTNLCANDSYLYSFSSQLQLFYVI